MHMADALISPIVGGTMLAVTAGIGGYCVRRVETEQLEKKLPLMGTMGAFVFAAQMLNFTIPGTGASGHLCGGILLAALLGPYAGFLTIAAILLIQALFFADGGLLALGSNVFNIGFLSCFVAYPLIFKPIMQKEQGVNPKRIWFAAIVASIVGLQLGAFGVVLETTFSGKTTNPFGAFAGMMQLIHLAIGLIEGCIIGAVLSFVHKTTPHFISETLTLQKAKTKRNKYGWLALWAVIILVTAGALSHLASSNPDGLEWSILKVTGSEELESEQTSAMHESAQSLQESVAILPDYDFKEGTSSSWLSGTTVAGIIGSGITFVMVLLLGWVTTHINKRLKRLEGANH